MQKKLSSIFIFACVHLWVYFALILVFDLNRDLARSDLITLDVTHPKPPNLLQQRDILFIYIRAVCDRTSCDILQTGTGVALTQDPGQFRPSARALPSCIQHSFARNVVQGMSKSAA